MNKLDYAKRYTEYENCTFVDCRRRKTARRLHSQTVDDLFSPPAVCDDVEELRTTSDRYRRLQLQNTATVDDVASSIYLRSAGLIGPSADAANKQAASMPTSPSPLCHYHRYIRAQLQGAAIHGNALQYGVTAGSNPGVAGTNAASDVNGPAITANPIGIPFTVGDPRYCWQQSSQQRLSTKSVKRDADDTSAAMTEDDEADSLVAVSLIDVTNVGNRTVGGVRQVKSSALDDIHNRYSLAENRQDELVYY
jgi:hypothetical protein